MKLPTYGKLNRERNYYHEVREAILYKKEDLLKKFADTIPDTVLLVMKEGISIDPSIVATICPQFLPQVQDHLIELSQDENGRLQQQVPEIVLRVAKMDTLSPYRLWQAFAASCRQYSLQYILEGIGTYDISLIEDFIIEHTLGHENCKMLLDFTLYYTDFDRDQYVKLFINHKDIFGLCDMIGRNLIDVALADDVIYAAVDLHKTDADGTDFQTAYGTMMQFLSQVKDKANLDRVETMFIGMDNDEIMGSYIQLFPDRSAIPDYLSIKTILHS
jgi:hypothetical protein